MYSSAVVAVSLLAAIGAKEFAEAQDATVTFEIVPVGEANRAQLAITVPAIDVAQFFKDGEFRPVFTPVAGKIGFVLAPIPPNARENASNFELPTTFRIRYEKEIAEVIQEVRQNCDPTPEQLDKLDAAAVGTLLHLTRRVRQLSNCRVSANIPQELEKLAKEVNNVNELVRRGAMEPHTLFRKMLDSVLTNTQLARLRWTYTLPLVQIMEDHEILVQAEQRVQLESLVSETGISPFVLRNNYGQQYRNLMGLGDEVLSKVFNPQQMKLLSDRGRTDYRITLSR